MFDLSTAHFVQLLIALILGVGVFVISYVGLYGKLFSLLIATLPFQLINSRYGSLNMVLIFVVGLGVFLGKKRKEGTGHFLRPISFCLFLVGMAYGLSFLNNPRPLLILQLSYLVGLASVVVLFYMTYRLINTEEDLHHFFKLLLIMNVLVLIYCFIQLIAGFTQVIPFGIQEFAFVKNRLQEGLDERRLTGPFLAPGILAEYFALMILVFIYYLMSTGRMKKIIIPVVFANLCAMVGTGNRGAPIAMIIGFFLFFLFFRQRLRGVKTFKYIIVGVLLAAVASIVMLRYTQFDVLYERFAKTEIEGLTPDTRKGWPDYIEKALETPYLGKGVRMILPSDLYNEKGEKIPGIPPDKVAGYPHSLYIYIFYTMGIGGLMTYALLTVCLYVIFVKMARNKSSSLFVSGLPKLAIVVFTVFCVDQFKIEFLRHNYLDYQHVIAAIIAMFLAANKVLAKEQRMEKT